MVSDHGLLPVEVWDQFPGRWPLAKRNRRCNEN
jgi:hypothetical protein